MTTLLLSTRFFRYVAGAIFVFASLVLLATNTFAAPQVTTLGDGVDAATSTIGPDASATLTDAFTLQTDNATSVITQALVTLNGGQENDGVAWVTSAGAASSTVNNPWYGITYGNGLFVAVAATTTDQNVMTSPDGVTWTLRTGTTTNSWVSVTYGNGLFVAVSTTGTGNRVMTSPDGITWTSRTSAVDNGWNSVTYGNDLFVAVSSTGTGNRVMTSPDGITWTSRTSAADNSWFGVTYGNGLFVAVAESGIGNRVMTSPDGITWTTRTSASDNNWSSVVYGNGLFVAVAETGTGNRVMTSPDGITWTSRTSAADNNWFGIAYGNGLFVAIATSGTGNRVMTSPDGITWTIRTSAANNTWNGVIYGNGLFVAAASSGTGNRVMTSSSGITQPRVLGRNNGVTWATSTAAANNWWQSVTYGNGLFVAVSVDGTGNGVMTSPDGLTWTIRTSAADNNWTSVTYGNGLFVAVGASGTGNRVMTSPDGITWTSRTSAADNAWSSIAYGNGLFVAIACGIGATSCNATAGNRVMTSSDGITWTSQTSASNNQWFSIAHGNGLFVAVSITGSGNRVMTSPDGITWTSRTSAADNQWRGVAYGSGLFVAISDTGTGNRVMTSPDGVTWSTRTSAADSSWQSVVYGNGLFVAVPSSGGGNRVMVSATGTSWTLASSTVDNGWTSVAYGGGRFVSVSNTLSGTINDRVMTSNSGTFYNQPALFQGVATVEVTNDAGTIVYGSVTNPTSDTFSIPLTTTTLTATASSTQYRLRITPKSHANMPAATSTGATDYMLTPRVLAVSGTDGITVGEDGAGAVTTVDNIVSTALPAIGTFQEGTSNVFGSIYSIAYGNGLFVALDTDFGYRYTSTDGITWSSGNTAYFDYAYSIAYGNGLFVAVNTNGGVMTSPDGITWTSRTSAAVNGWYSVTYGNGLFVVVSYDGSGNRVMTSPDGITWTSRISAADNQWSSITYGNGLFVAVSADGSGNRVMTSPDGITWTSRTSAANNQWYSVTYGNGLFVAVAQSGTSRVMTSSDGITWTSRTASSAKAWRSVTYGNGMFLAGSQTGLMYSRDGITWTDTSVTTSAYSVMYAGGKFIVGGYWESYYSSNLTTAFDSSKVSLTFSSPRDSDISNTLALQSTNPITDTPTEGISYATSTVLAGGASVACSFAVTASTTYTCNATNITSGVPHYFKLFMKDSRGNYSQGIGPSGAVTPQRRITIDTGSDTPSTTLLPGGTATTSDTFTLAADSGTDVIQSITAYVGFCSMLSLIEITNDAGTIVYGSSTNPYLSVIIPLTQNTLTVTTTPTQYRIRVTPHSHTDMPVPPSSTCGLQTYVASITGTGITYTINNDTANTLISIDNASPSAINISSASWSNVTTPANNVWQSVTYGNGLFVAVSSSGTGNRVMTSPDGVTWTSRTSAADNFWGSVAYGNGLFVAVASGVNSTLENSTAGNRVMTSPDGITWSMATTTGVLSTNQWENLTFGNNQFVAIAAVGSSGARVMTSPDGINWTSRTSAADQTWQSVAYGSSTFVAVASTGAPNTNVMISTDNGVTWAVKAAGMSATLTSITYGNGLFVAVACGAGGTNCNTSTPAQNRVMTSPDGVTWTQRSAYVDYWEAVTYGNGLFTAVATLGTTQGAMTSPDGITWTRLTTPTNLWKATAYGSEKFVAVASTGTGNRAMLNLPSSYIATSTQIAFSFLTPSVSDLSSIIVLQSTASTTDTPTEGVSYATSSTIGSSTVICSYGVATTTGLYSCTASDLTNSQAYYYRFFTKDTIGNYSIASTIGPIYPGTFTTTLATGNDATSSVVLAPGGTATTTDSFTFSSDTEIDTITSVTVTMNSGTSAGVSLLEIIDVNESFVYGSTTNPGSDTPTITLSTPLTSSTTATTYKIRITPKSHANMPAAPGTSYVASTTISGWAGTGMHMGTDTTRRPVTIDNTSPLVVTVANASSTSGTITVSYTTPTLTDISSAIILQSTSTASTATTTEGATYTVGDTVGSSTVRCVTAVSSASSYTCAANGLTNGTVYYFRIFTKDTSGNYSLPTDIGPYAPGGRTITLGASTSTDPVSITLLPGALATTSDTFTFKTDTATDSITSITLRVATGTSAALSLVEITNATSSFVYGSTTSPSSDTFAVNLSTPLSITTATSTYTVRITPKSHINMPIATGSVYIITSIVTAWNSTSAIAGSDSSTSTVTIDNLSPDSPTSISVLKTTQEQIRISYMSATTTDAQDTIILRSPYSSVDTPVEGANYTVGNAIGASTVLCVASSTPLGGFKTCTFSSPARSSNYYFKLFTKDSTGNYSSGILALGTPVFIAAPNSGRVLSSEAEISNGATTTVAGGAQSGGYGGVGTTTGATTTVSTSTPSKGGGSGDSGNLYRPSNLASFFQKTFSFFVAQSMTKGAETVYAERIAPPINRNACEFKLLGICIASTVPWVSH